MRHHTISLRLGSLLIANHEEVIYMEPRPTQIAGLSGLLAKSDFHLAANSGPNSFSSSSVGRHFIPASTALEKIEKRSAYGKLLILQKNILSRHAAFTGLGPFDGRR